jgi:hypothetical protein
MTTPRLPAAGFAAATAFAVNVILASATVGHAHDAPAGWIYPQFCCSGYDCRPVPASDVEEGPKGYVIRPTGELVPMSSPKVKDSPDGEYHWCSVAGADDGKTICLFVDFVTGAGFVGIAVALMGRSHPAGIVPAAILFGALYQGGANLAFEMPNISRDMIVIIQGLVILFAGALEHMLRPQVQALFASFSPRSVGLPAARTGGA